jgi:hypothetical protein
MIFLHDLLDDLSLKDIYFKSYWDNISQRERKSIIQLLLKIDSSYNHDLEFLIELNEMGYNLIEKYFHLIPQKKFSYIDNITKSWEKFVLDPLKKESIKIKVEGLLFNFINTTKFRRNVKLYGGIKPLDSILEKEKRHRNSFDYLEENKFNIWDVVRYRCVLSSIEDVFIMAIYIWEYFYKSILRCRNYYFKPMNLDYSKHYKGVNFIVAIDDVFFEIQVLTKIKEIDSYLDYFYLYKKKDIVQNQDLESWLNKILLKSNLFEIDNSLLITNNCQLNLTSKYLTAIRKLVLPVIF